MNKIIRQYAPESITKYNRLLVKGAFFLMEEDLLRLPEEKWRERIVTLKPHFGYGIGQTTYDELALDAEQKFQLHQGKIVIIENGDYLYHQVVKVVGASARGRVRVYYIRQIPFESL